MNARLVGAEGGGIAPGTFILEVTVGGEGYLLPRPDQ